MVIANKTIINKLWDNDSSVMKQGDITVDFNHVAPKDRTHVFALSPEVALAAEKLLHSSAFKMADVSEWHIPYPHVAIEYPITDEIATLYRPTELGTERITKIGAHIHEFDGSGHGFLFTPYWEYKTGQLQCSWFTFIIGGSTELDGQAPSVILNMRHTLDGSIKAYVIPSAGFATACMNAGIPAGGLVEIYKKQEVQRHIRESAVEIPALLFACNMLLTCKSGIGKREIAERKPKMSGLGGRMRKKLSASAYTVLHLSEIEDVEDDGTIKSKVDISAHYVRGHFKQRKRGVYWWSAYIRGTGEPKKRYAYIVKE